MTHNQNCCRSFITTGIYLQVSLLFSQFLFHIIQKHEIRKKKVFTCQIVIDLEFDLQTNTQLFKSQEVGTLLKQYSSISLGYNQSFMYNYQIDHLKLSIFKVILLYIIQISIYQTENMISNLSNSKAPLLNIKNINLRVCIPHFYKNEIEEENLERNEGFLTLYTGLRCQTNQARQSHHQPAAGEPFVLLNQRQKVIEKSFIVCASQFYVSLALDNVI